METFFTTSEKIEHIIKSFNLTKTLFVSSIIIGEQHTGKKTLAQHILPDAVLVSGVDQDKVQEALAIHDELIITDFEKLSNPTLLDLDNKRIIATANYMGNASLIDDAFAFIYAMPPLNERHEDVAQLVALFAKEACDTLMIDIDSIDMNILPINLTKNAKSLKRSIYLDIVKLSMAAEDIQDITYAYILKALDGNDGYREHLSLYEKPLIEAGLKKYGSQLQLSQVLGINRNTLRKKIHEHNIN